MACSLSIMLARSRLSATGTACVPPLTSLCYPPLACFHGENSLSVCVVCVLFCSVGSKQAEPNQHNASNQSHWSGTDRVRLLPSAARTACTSLRRFLCWRVLMAHLLALFWLHSTYQLLQSSPTDRTDALGRRRDPTVLHYIYTIPYIVIYIPFPTSR